MFRLTWVNNGECSNSNDFSSIDFIVSEHKILYTTCSGISHSLTCNFSSIFDKVIELVSSEEFKIERPYCNCNDGDWYSFEYMFDGKVIKYEGYIYGLRKHEELVELVNSCASDILREERMLLDNNFGKTSNNGIEKWASDIMKSRQELCNDFFRFWEDI